MGVDRSAKERGYNLWQSNEPSNYYGALRVMEIMR